MTSKHPPKNLKQDFRTNTQWLFDGNSNWLKLPTAESPTPEQASGQQRVNGRDLTSRTDNAEALSNNGNAAVSSFEKREDQLTANQFGDEYEILAAIGTGAVCTVYSVRSKSLGQNFALKVLSEDLVSNAAALRQFNKEIVAAAYLTHQNVAPIYGHGQTSKGAPFIVQHLCEGSNLAQIIRHEGRLDQLEH